MIKNFKFLIFRRDLPGHRCKGISMTVFTEADLKAFREGGNQVAHGVWLSGNPPKPPRPQDAAEMKSFLKQKYEQKKWYNANALVKVQSGQSNAAVEATFTMAKPPSKRTPSVPTNTSANMLDFMSDAVQTVVETNLAPAPALFRQTSDFGSFVQSPLPMNNNDDLFYGFGVQSPISVQSDPFASQPAFAMQTQSASAPVGSNWNQPTMMPASKPNAFDVQSRNIGLMNNVPASVDKFDVFRELQQEHQSIFAPVPQPVPAPTQYNPFATAPVQASFEAQSAVNIGSNPFAVGSSFVYGPSQTQFNGLSTQPRAMPMDFTQNPFTQQAPVQQQHPAYNPFAASNNVGVSAPVSHDMSNPFATYSSPFSS